MFPAPHGAVCAALLPHALDVNFRAAKQQSNAPFLKRFGELGKLFTGNDSAVAADVIDFVEKLCAELNTPKLRNYGVEEQHFELLSERAAASSSMKANPVQLTRAQLLEILQRAR
jgi:alcohol dehydrogenase class IV